MIEVHVNSSEVCREVRFGVEDLLQCKSLTCLLSKTLSGTEAKDWNTLYRIKKFDNCMTEKCLENAAVILKQVLEENKFPLYKSENDKLYKKQDGTYRRIKDIYAELAGGE